MVEVRNNNFIKFNLILKIFNYDTKNFPGDLNFIYNKFES